MDEPTILRCNEHALIAALWRLLWNLVRDVSSPVLDDRERDGDEQAQDDDLLDAWLDEDGIDATGL